MVAYSFKGRFIEPITTRCKRQTIRAIGKKRHARPGEQIQLYTGDRFHPRKMGEAKCLSSITITLAFGDSCKRPLVIFGDPLVGQVLVAPAHLDGFAVNDGFADWQALADFWAETHAPLPAEWTGILITWGDTFAPSTPPAGDTRP